MDYRYRLGLVGNLSTASGNSNCKGMVALSYGQSVGTFLFLCPMYLFHIHFYFFPFFLSFFVLFHSLLFPFASVGEHSCTSSTFSIAILNGTDFFRNAI